MAAPLRLKSGEDTANTCYRPGEEKISALALQITRRISLVINHSKYTCKQLKHGMNDKQKKTGF
jgi:hypothetical protein